MRNASHCHPHDSRPLWVGVGRGVAAVVTGDGGGAGATFDAVGAGVGDGCVESRGAGAVVVVVVGATVVEVEVVVLAGAAAITGWAGEGCVASATTLKTESDSVAGSNPRAKRCTLSYRSGTCPLQASPRNGKVES